MIPRSWSPVLAGGACFGVLSTAALAGDPDGTCTPEEAGALLCFEAPNGFVVEVVTGPDGEFPYINNNGDSVFAYKLSGPGSTGGECAGVHDISHASIKLPICPDPGLHIISSSPEVDLKTGGEGDPSCGFGHGDLEHDVAKWDVGVDCSEVRTFSITLAGVVEAEATEFSIKAARDCWTAEILGPGCPDDTDFCFGDETCPCDNPDPSGGCRTSTGIGGRLTQGGSTSVSADDLLLAGEGLPIEQFTVLFMGDRATPNAGTIGDGRRCIGGDIFRFPKLSSGPLGRVVYGPGLAEFSCAVFRPEGCIMAGSTWYFQLWFRDPDGPCFTGFNTTNATRVTFTP